MRKTKFYLGFCLILSLVSAGCGGGSSSPPATSTAAPTLGPTSAPTPTPSGAPGVMQIAYSSTFGANSGATNAPPAIAFLAETQTVTVNATQANFSGAYSAATNGACGANVTVAPATSATGVFTITAVMPVTVAAGCQVVFAGNAPASAVSVAASVPPPGGVVLNWLANAAYATQPAPILPGPGPINLIGTTALFGAIVVISETHYLGAFNAPVLSVGCGANLSAPTVVAQGNILGPQASLAQTQAYYMIVAPAAATAFTLAAACTVTVSDQAPSVNTSSAMGVTLTTTGGSIN